MLCVMTALPRSFCYFFLFTLILQFFLFFNFFFFNFHFSFKLFLKGYSSDQSHFSEINVKLAEKNKYATRSVQRSLEMCENMEKPSVSEDFRQKSSTSDAEKFHQ